MLTADQINQAASHFVHARRTSTPGLMLPEVCRAKDNDSALAIQRRTLELLGENIGGWKCGVPNPTLIIAPLTASSIVRSTQIGSTPCAVPPPIGLIEPEIAFVMARDLPARAAPYSDAEIRGAIGEAHMVLELLGSRFADRLSAAPLDMLSDMYNNYGLLVGPKIENVFDLSLEKLHVTIRTDDKVLFEADRPHPSGHPMKAFTWLVHFLNQHGEGVQAGQTITTGSYAGIVEAPIGTPLHVELGGVGVLNTTLVPR